MIKKRELPSREVLESLFSYDPSTGSLKWKERPISSFPSERLGRAWNSRCAGKEAGSFQKSHKSGKKIIVRLMNTSFVAHRIAWVLSGKELPSDDMHIDHINGNAFDNRIDNLRIATNQQNTFNRAKGSKKPFSISGVHWVVRDKSWTACIRYNYKTVHLGTFRSKGEAAVAAAKASLRYFGKFSPYYRAFA